MSLPKKSEVADANYDDSYPKLRARQNRLFLYDVVLPHLESMPTLEDYELKLPNTKGKTAMLDLGEYCDARNASGPVMDAYTCERQGCFAGWYVFVSDKYDRLSELEISSLRRYSHTQLSNHFGITYGESERLFSARGSGAEKTLSMHVDTRKALALRKKKLISIMKRKKDFA